MTSCGAMVSYTAGGELRWVEPIQDMLSHWLAAVDDGVVLAMAFGETFPIMVGIAASGEQRWEQPWPLEFPNMGFTGYLASDGSGAFYVAGSTRGCGAIERHAASDGSLLWHAEVCGDQLAVSNLSDVLVVGDASVVAIATGSSDESALVGFDAQQGEQQLSAQLSYPARTSGAGPDAAWIVAREVGPLAAIDISGEAQWQWPGAVAGGVGGPHPTGL
jgi:outer membrane protein assembly factor BamB